MRPGEGLDEILAEIQKEIQKSKPSPWPITPFGQRASRKQIEARIVHDSNPGEANNKYFSRIVRLQCTNCAAQWSACYEGPTIRHREDLICFRCSKP